MCTSMKSELAFKILIYVLGNHSRKNNVILRINPFEVFLGGLGIIQEVLQKHSEHGKCPKSLTCLM